ncbi:MAG: hypothetical protein H8E38_07610 [SAR324 cluster bacterium]|nr:hypothetical protein [SAR324 cluster bacterium]MBL7034527.1 hypothetical protein [SAR324 cluster bacterium]
MKENKEIMKKRYSGEEWIKILKLLEKSISEGWVDADFENQSENNELHEDLNIFGRSVINSKTKNQLAYIAGLSATGLRAAAFIPGDQLLAHYADLVSAAKRLLSCVTYLSLSSGHQPYHAAADAGFFQWMAKDASEAVDLGLLTHKIAELSLVPGLVGLDAISDSAELEADIFLPDKVILQKILGNADDMIAAPTPAQAIIFGETRRRIPNWFNFDTPTFNYLQKDAQAGALETAARQPFFYDHLAKIIQDVLDEYTKLTGKKTALLESFETQDAEQLILVEGAAFETVKAAVEQLREQKKKVGCLRVVMHRPFPGAELVNLLSGKKAVTILDQSLFPASAEGPLFREVAGAINKAEENTAGNIKFPEYPLLGKTDKPLLFGVYCGLGGAVITKDEVITVFENAMGKLPSKSGLFAGKKREQTISRQRFFTGVSFINANQEYPKVAAELARLRVAYPDLERLTLADEGFGKKKAEAEFTAKTESGITELPLVVKNYRDQGQPYTQLSRFQNQKAAFYQHNKIEELNVTPFDALPAVPAATAELRDMSQERIQVPVFIPAECTGCGDCFVRCPESALPPVVSSPEELLKSAAIIAAEKNEPITQLTPLLKPIALATGKFLRETTAEIKQAADFFPQAFAKTIEQKKTSAESQEIITAEFQRLMNIMSEFPLAQTEIFFKQAEAQKRGAGELFSIAIDSYSCSGCGICTEECQENALQMEIQTPEIEDKQRSNFRFWEKLPDTSLDTMRRVLEDAEYSSFSAVLLSRNYYKSLGQTSSTNIELKFKSDKTAEDIDAEKKYFGEKVILHLILAVTESVMQPAVAAFARETNDLHDLLAQRIQAEMRDALPHDSFTALAQTLSDASKTRVYFDELLHQVIEKEHTAPVDITTLRSLVNLEQSISELNWVLTQGPTGIGRARMGLCMLGQHSMKWGQKYPEQPFFFPVWAQGEHADPAVTLGLLDGQLRHYLDNIRLVHRAKLEAKGKYKPHLHDAEIASLSWDDLSESERAACPKIFLLGDHKSLNEQSISTWSVLLNSKLPIRIIILDSAAAVSPQLHASVLAKVDLLSMSYRNAFVLQSSLVTPEHFHDGLVKGLNFQGPALFHLHVPDSKLADELLLQSRTFPVFTFDPDKKGVFGNLIDLSGNPQTSAKVENFADWAFTQERFNSHFTALDDAATASIPLSMWLEEESPAAEMVAFIEQTLADGETRRFKVSQEILKAGVLVRDHWRMLQEISGEQTPFTAKVQKELKEQTTAEHQEDLDSLKAEYEKKLQELEMKYQQRTKDVIRERLLALAGYPAN